MMKAAFQARPTLRVWIVEFDIGRDYLVFESQNSLDETSKAG